jgi:hypothetical protein
MSKFTGSVDIGLAQELRVRAERGTDVPELLEFLLNRLEMEPANAALPAIMYFRSAFNLTLREALPIRELLGGDRSEVDTILIPAMQRTKSHWQARDVMPV